MESDAVTITEKLLSGAGGWEAMKAARELVKTGRVAAATYEGPLLAGEVREGAKNYRAGLRVRSASDLENICTCRESREWGKICAHSLAVGLAYLAPPRAPEPVAPAASARPEMSRFVSLGEGEARPITLHWILPPNFPSAWTKGQVMICVEAELDGRRVMLDTLSAAERFACDDADLVALSSLGSEAASVNMLSRAAFVRWLSTLRGHPRLGFGKAATARVLGEICRPILRVRRSGDDYEVTAQFATEETPLLAGAEAWLLRGRDFLEIGSNLPPRLTNVLPEPLRLKGERADEFFALELPLWREVAEVELPVGLDIPEVAEAQPAFRLKIEGSMQQLRTTLHCRYGERPAFAPTAEPANRFVFREGTRLLMRNLAAETEAIARLERVGFVRDGGAFEMRDANRVARFFAFDFPALPAAWEITVSPRLEKASSELESVAPTIEIVGSGEDWFELRYSVAPAAGEGIPLAEVQRLLRSGQTQTRMKNGRIAVLNAEALDDFEQVLRDADPRQSQPGLYRLNKIQAGYLTNTAEEIGAKLIGAAEALRSGAAPSVVEGLGTLGEQLRDYQLTGVSWLAALAAQNLGGILADEMGLGKTVQTLALLRLHRGRGPALIVCPTSLLSNWQREAERFTPELKLLLIDGTDRAAKIARLANYDLGLTSYGLLRRDGELYAGVSLSSAVLDEAQHIKNPETQNAQAAFGLRAARRFVLTGTPMENSVRDLWSLMNFVAPGYLGSRNEFRERYEKPLTEGRASARPDP
ncbi:MAG: SNF2-related protein, partial [Chthoniobacterales bacterium]